MFSLLFLGLGWNGRKPHGFPCGLSSSKRLAPPSSHGGGRVLIAGEGMSNCAALWKLLLSYVWYILLSKIGHMGMPRL